MAISTGSAYMDTITFDQALEILSIPEDTIIHCSRPAVRGRIPSEVVNTLSKDEFILAGIDEDIAFTIRREFNEQIAVYDNKMVIRLSADMFTNPLDVLYVTIYFPKSIKKLTSNLKD